MVYCSHTITNVVAVASILAVAVEVLYIAGYQWDKRQAHMITRVAYVQNIIL